MTTYYSQGSALASVLTNWDSNAGGGGSDPASALALDNNAMVIQAGHTITWDLDMTNTTDYPNGIAGLTIESHATTPGMLQYEDDDGVHCIAIKASSNIVGTNAAVFGRIKMHAGTWGSPTAFAVARKSLIWFRGAGKIAAQYLAFEGLAATPTYESATIYGGTGSTLTGKIGVTVDYTAAREFTLASGSLANGNRIKFTGTALPAGIVSYEHYYVINYSGGSFSVSPLSGGVKQSITSNGTSVEVYTGCASGIGATEHLLTLENLHTDANWEQAAPFNKVCIVNEGVGTQDTQITTIASIDDNNIHLAANLDSAQYPGTRIWLAVRNAMIMSDRTDTAAVIDMTSRTLSATNIWDCRVALLANASTTANRYGIGIGAGTSVTGTAIATFGIVSGFYEGVSGGTLHLVDKIIASTYPHSIDVAAGTYYTINTIMGGAYVNSAGNFTIGEMAGLTTGLSACTNCSVTTLRHCNRAISTGYGNSVTTVSQCTDIYALLGLTVGTVRGLTTGIADSFSVKCTTVEFTTYAFDRCMNCTAENIRYCTQGCRNCMGTMFNSKFVGNVTYDIWRPRGQLIYGGQLGHATAASRVFGYLHAAEGLKDQDNGVTIYDYRNPSTGASRVGYIGRWDCGGYTITEEYSSGSHGTPTHIASDPIHVTLAQDNDVEHRVELPANPYKPQADCPVIIQARSMVSGAAPTGWDVRPTFELVDPANNTVLRTWTMADNTDWQLKNLGSLNSGTAIPIVRMRCRGGNAGGTGSTHICQWFVTFPSQAYGGASSGLLLEKVTGSEARGGSGNCAKLTHDPTTAVGDWFFLVPCTAGQPINFSFWWKKSNASDTYNNHVGMIQDSPSDSTSADWDLSAADTDWHQFSMTSDFNADADGFVLVQISVVITSGSGYVLIDDAATS